jgi:hypothetical protein
MAKDPWKETADQYGNRPNEDWAGNLKKFRDPVSGKVLEQNPQGNAYPVGSKGE